MLWSKHSGFYKLGSRLAPVCVSSRGSDRRLSLDSLVVRAGPHPGSQLILSLNPGFLLPVPGVRQRPLHQRTLGAVHLCRETTGKQPLNVLHAVGGSARLLLTHAWSVLQISALQPVGFLKLLPANRRSLQAQVLILELQDNVSLCPRGVLRLAVTNAAPNTQVLRRLQLPWRQ